MFLMYLNALKFTSFFFLHNVSAGNSYFRGHKQWERNIQTQKLFRAFIGANTARGCAQRMVLTDPQTKYVNAFNICAVQNGCVK